MWSGTAPSYSNSEKAVSDMHQPWHADDAGAGRRFQRIRLHFEKLQEYGPPRGHFPEPSKSILIVEEHNKEKAEACFKDSDWKVVTECRCLVGLIGNKAEQREWVEEKAQT
jgi:hypothetical protein